jgi:hypothetical protein
MRGDGRDKDSFGMGGSECNAGSMMSLSVALPLLIGC